MNRSVDVDGTITIRQVSPLERSQIIYQIGREKLRQINDDSKINDSYYHQNADHTFKPTLDKHSMRLVHNNRSGSRVKITECYKDAY